MAQVSPGQTKCQYPVGAFVGYQIDGVKLIAGTLRCNNWACPACNPRLKSRLRRRILQGEIVNQAVPRYGLKFLTLTFGGKELQALHNPEEAYDIMSFHFRNLIKALKKHYGNFHYLRVCELHKNGYPHFHVILAGKSVVPRSILGHIENLWRNVYGLGFVKLNAKNKKGEVLQFKNVKHAVNYLLKYITKDVKKAGKGKRVFTCSRKALQRIEKKEWLSMKVYVGSVDDHGIHEHEIRVVPTIFGHLADMTPLGRPGHFCDIHHYAKLMAEKLMNDLKIKEK